MGKSPDTDADDAPGTDEPGVVNLSSPVMAFGEEVDRITFREPLGKDVREIGFPFKIHSDESFEPSAPIISKYIARLATPKLTPGVVDELSAYDFKKCMEEIMGFFGDARETSSTSPGTSRESSEDAPATP